MSHTDAEAFAREKFQEFVAKVDATWNTWLDSIRHLTKGEMLTTGTCGEWSVKDLIAHIAVWDRIAIDKVQSVTTGEFRDTGETWEQINDRTSQESRDVPLDELTSSMHDVHANLMASLSGAASRPSDILERIEWAIAEDTTKHYPDHMNQVRARFATSD